ncbi:MULTISPECIES: LapA family protein [Parabacteroides]|jgi:hypothetical protein|nr:MULTISPECIES: LapA family protein [Parabacteroides]MCL3852186.1 LapA family protein [Parabacteroides leei]
MLSLLLSTLEMMALTFIIGFVVAGVIKLIAVWADSLEFHHNEELSQFSKLNKLRAKIGEILGLDSVNEEEEQVDDEREEFRQGVNSDLLHIKPSGYYHGVSHGASHLDLMDYYYPQDTRIMYLKKKEQMMRKNNTNKEENPSTEK